MSTQHTDDPIRKLLADLPPAMYLGNPTGTLAIWESKVVEAGADRDAVLAWVREHGGYLEKSLPSKVRRGKSISAVGSLRQFFVVPEEALR